MYLERFSADIVFTSTDFWQPLPIYLQFFGPHSATEFRFFFISSVLNYRQVCTVCVNHLSFLCARYIFVLWILTYWRLLRIFLITIDVFVFMSNFCFILWVWYILYWPRIRLHFHRTHEITASIYLKQSWTLEWNSNTPMHSIMSNNTSLIILRQMIKKCTTLNRFEFNVKYCAHWRSGMKWWNFTKIQESSTYISEGVHLST